MDQTKNLKKQPAGAIAAREKRRTETAAERKEWLPDLALVKGGTFQMGSTDESNERPVHSVTVSDFYMAKFAVTRGEFVRFVAETGYITTAEALGTAWGWNKDKNWGEQKGYDFRNPGFPQTDAHPVVAVSWFDVVEFCNWISKKDGRQPCYHISGENISCDWQANGYRLPTEAEWEYAAGNGSAHTKFSWGDGEPVGRKGGNVAEISVKRQFPDWTIFEGYDCGFVFTAPVGSFDPNDFGLFDLTGNVWEWCWDWFEDYPSDPQTNPRGPETGLNRLRRGGSWYANPLNGSTTFRVHFAPAFRFDAVGFRLVSALPVLQLTSPTPCDE